MEVWLLYKFDPMDFETCETIKQLFPSSQYKFDPMDFETQVYKSVDGKDDTV